MRPARERLALLQCHALADGIQGGLGAEFESRHEHPAAGAPHQREQVQVHVHPGIAAPGDPDVTAQDLLAHARDVGARGHKGVGLEHDLAQPGKQ